jgi:hypothetical protein
MMHEICELCILPAANDELHISGIYKRPCYNMGAVVPHPFLNFTLEPTTSGEDHHIMLRARDLEEPGISPEDGLPDYVGHQGHGILQAC